MEYRILKRIRVGVSVFFFLLISFLFLDFSQTFSSVLINGILYFQFVPSLLKFVNLITVAATGFILIFILTFLFGRIYCSAFCPLGTLQDIIIYLKSGLRKKNKFRFVKAKKLMRYGFLLIAVTPLAFNSIATLNLLDPYSNFGRIMSNLVRPVYYTSNNLLAKFLEKFDNYSVYPVEIKSVNYLALGFSAFMLILVIRLAYKNGRLFCNSVCPVGTLLGLVSKLSVFKISLDQTLCTSCGKCAIACKAGCIDSKSKSVDFSRCVGCFNCLNSCPSDGVRFIRKGQKNRTQISLSENTIPKRDFLRNSLLYIMGIGAASQSSFGEGINDEKIPVVKQNPVSPPGSQSIQHFINYCTACHLCISACPTQVLQPALLQYGIGGLMQPTMDYKTSFCNFECVVCSTICPTGAILPLDPEEKKTTQLGKAKFIKQNCVVYTDGTDCGACSEHCPTKAVDMVYYEGKLTIPEVTENICIGCGACEYACPTTPKSIYVEGNAIHLVADKPEIKEFQKQVSPEDDFPF